MHRRIASLFLLAAGLGACGAPSDDSAAPGTPATEPNPVQQTLPNPESSPNDPTPDATELESLSPQESTVRIFSEEWLAALEERFPAGSYPAVGKVLESYQQSRDAPTEANYRAAGDAKYAFGETLPADGARALRTLDERVQMRVFARVNVLVMQEIAERWAEAFPVDAYPAIASVTERAASMEAEGPQAPRRVERPYRAFLEGLNATDRQRAIEIEADVRDAWGMR